MTHQTSISNRAWAELFLLGFIWGGSFLSIRIALDEIGPLTSVLHRVGWAAVILWAVVWWQGLALPRSLRIWGAFLVMGLLNNAIPFVLMAWGQLYVETGLTSIFNAATAIWGVLVAAVFFADERLGVRKLAGVLLGFGGVTLAIGIDALRSFDLRSLAQLAIVAGTLSYALASAWARVHLKGLPPQVAAAGMLTGSTLLMIPVVLLTEGVPRLDLLPQTWGAIGYYAIVATAIAYLFYFRILAMVGTGNAMLVTLIVAPVAIVLGALVRDETLAPNAYAGLVLLALGLIVLDGRVFRRNRG